MREGVIKKFESIILFEAMTGLLELLTQNIKKWKFLLKLAEFCLLRIPKIVNNKIILIGPYLVTPSKPPPNHFLFGAGRQFFSSASQAESARVHIGALWSLEEILRTP